MQVPHFGFYIYILIQWVRWTLETLNPKPQTLNPKPFLHLHIITIGQVDIGNRLSGISCSALPLSSLSRRLVSYWGVAQGFRSLLAVMSCELLASSAYIFMGALGAAAAPRPARHPAPADRLGLAG